MNNSLLQIKIKERLNKLDSDDYENISCWQIQEAFNKAQREWVRRQVNGMNQRREGRETSSQEISDLQNLLKTFISSFENTGLYYESDTFPSDYLVFARVSADAIRDNCCPPRRLVIYQEEESDVDMLLKSPVKRPDYDYAETFSTYFANKLRIYTDNKFEIVNPKLIYYRAPVTVMFLGCIDIETNTVVTTDVECEFTNGVTELIIDDAASILSGDIENYNNKTRLQQNSQQNT